MMLTDIKKLTNAQLQRVAQERDSTTGPFEIALPTSRALAALQELNARRHPRHFMILKLYFPRTRPLSFDIETPSGKPLKKVTITLDDGRTQVFQDIEAQEIEEVPMSPEKCPRCRQYLPRALIAKRKEAKRENARRSWEKAIRQGKKLGAKPKVGAHLKNYVFKKRAEGESLRKIAKDIGVSASSVQRFLERHHL